MILQILCQSLQTAKIQQIQHRRTVRKIKGSMLGCPKKLKFFSRELCDGSKIRKIIGIHLLAEILPSISMQQRTNSIIQNYRRHLKYYRETMSRNATGQISVCLVSYLVIYSTQLALNSQVTSVVRYDSISSYSFSIPIRYELFLTL